MALAYPYDYFGPVCDIQSQQVVSSGAIEATVILSVANIRDSIVEAATQSTVSLTTSGDFGPVCDSLVLRQIAQAQIRRDLDGTADADGGGNNFVGRPNIQPEIDNAGGEGDGIGDLSDGIIEDPSIGLSGKTNNLNTSGFGPVCDNITDDDDGDGDGERRDDKEEPNINLDGDGDGDGDPGDGERPTKKPQICRTISSVNLVAGEFGGVCDIQGGGGEGGFYDCPDDPDLDPEFEPKIPVPHPDWGPDTNDPGPNPKVHCYNLRLGVKACIPDPNYKPTFIEPPDNPDWPDPGDGKIGDDNIDKDRKRKRRLDLFYQLTCDDYAFKNTSGVFDKKLPAHMDTLIVEVMGAGGGAGGYDNAANSYGVSGDQIRFANDGNSLVAVSGASGSVTLKLEWDDDTSNAGVALDSLTVGGQTWTRSGEKGSVEYTINFSSGQTLPITYSNLNSANDGGIMVSDGNTRLKYRDGAGFDVNAEFKITKINASGGGLTATASNNSGGVGSFMLFQIALNPYDTNEIQFVIGGGGPGGRDFKQDGIPTGYAYNRGGRGGAMGEVGFSASGGAGGGATDFYLNNTLIASVAGGGGGGGNGGAGFDTSVMPGRPYANWNSFALGSNPLDTTAPGLATGVYSPIMYPYVFPVAGHVKGQAAWGDFLAQYAVWENWEQKPEPGTLYESRINLDFSTTGTYTFKVAADAIVGVYISYHDPANEEDASTYIIDGWENYLHGGDLVIGSTSGTPLADKDVDDIVSDGLSLPATLATESQWPDFTKIGQSTNVDTFDSLTYNITTAGRYVIKFVYGNDGSATDTDWLDNPAGFACQIIKPDSTELWTTRSMMGEQGEFMPSNVDGPGGGGGGGNGGPGGLTTNTIAAAIDKDMTAQGGSAGKNWIIDHPAVSLVEVRQAPQGFHSGWQTPLENKDASVRTATAGFGGGRPIKFAIIYDGTEYQLNNKKNGEFITAIIPGMGDGVWRDHMNGKTFPYHYFWGTSNGDYEGANNIPNITRTDPIDPRSLELALLWKPVKTGNSWHTEVRIKGLPSWGYGTGWMRGDTLNGVMPAAKSDGTQPWIDINTSGDWGRQDLTFTNNGNIVPAAIEGTSFNFSILIKETTNNPKDHGGRDGFVNYFATNTANSLLASSQGLDSGGDELEINYYGIDDEYIP